MMTNFHYERGSLSAERLQEAVEQIWRELQSSDTARQKAAVTIGVDTAHFADLPPNPFKVEQRRSGFGPVEIAIGVATFVVAPLTARMLHDLWQLYILEELKRRKGRDAVGVARSESSSTSAEQAGN